MTASQSDRLNKKDLLGIEDLSKEEIELILNNADAFKEVLTRDIKKVPTLRGKTVINLFLEPSTRTRTSFEIAEKRLSADTINISAQGSSLVKGETLKDMAKNLEAMNPDIIVIRHSASGSPHMLARLCRFSVINAGDGAHEHPTQALLDMLTIREKRGGLSGLKIAIVGDILHSRVARSNIFGLTRMGANVRVIGPPTLIPPFVEDLGVEVYHDLKEGVRGMDIIMMLRIQKERENRSLFPTIREYARFFCLTKERVALAKDDCLIMHPGPINRGVEIDPEVADGPYSVILNQVTNGVAIRMAVLYLLSGEKG
ncbi:aspartate carbamoyltransferase catalytic subunit [bacterium]|nr:aspartate carbamoyltransferase catalytic subunit [bacterium]